MIFFGGSNIGKGVVTLMQPSVKLSSSLEVLIGSICFHATGNGSEKNSAKNL